MSTATTPTMPSKTAPLARPGYKHTKLGWIPEEWEVKPLGDIGKWRGGGTPSKAEVSYWKGEIPWISSRDVKQRRLVDTELHISKEGLENSSAVLLPAKSLVLVTRSGILRHTLPVTVNQVPMAINQDIKAMIPEHLGDAEYVQLVLDGWNEQFLNACYKEGTTVESIEFDTLKGYRIPWPSIEERRRIAAVLGAWDRAIATAQQLLAAQHLRKQGLMQDLLTGKRRFPGFKGKWKEVRLQQLGDITNGGTPDTTLAQYWNGDIPWFTPTEITALSGKTTIERSERMLTKEGLANCTGSLLPAGSIIICTRATVGQAAILAQPGTTNQGFKNIVPNEKVSSKFLYYQIAIHVHKLQRLACGSTFPEVSMKDFRNLPVLLPERSEQDRICEVFDAIDGEINAMNAQLAHLTTQKRGLMQQLLTGAVRVNATLD